jgi:uridine phosphorylase
MINPIKNSNTNAVLEASELILNADGSVYHLHLLPEHIGDYVLLVGDQDRVARISSKFDSLEVKIQNREFVSHVGYVGKTKITALSTGIGTDNIDIVLNELDAAVNIDLSSRKIKKEKRSLNLIRIGTSGALQADIPVDSFVASSFGMGLDGLLHYYNFEETEAECELRESFEDYFIWPLEASKPYFAEASKALMKKVAHDLTQGITVTAPGFYAPQGRVLRLSLAEENLNDWYRNFNSNYGRISNFEMETSALYGLGSLLGHNCLTVCAIIANRYAMTYSKNYKHSVDKLIELVLSRIS